MSQSISRIGIDLAKNVFQVCTTDMSGNVLTNKKVSRKQLPEHIVYVPPCEVVMEACASAHYWARVFTRMGHKVKLIHPAYVRPYVKTNKNDAADAEALCEAASRPQMRFVQLSNRTSRHYTAFGSAWWHNVQAFVIRSGGYWENMALSFHWV
tara:strand:- start:512 stop:970 length:459 start_codon:yes stop_codon:yes gene_type:complete